MSPAQELSLIRLIRDVLCRYPDTEVVGHRNLAPPLCPGFDVVSSWRAEVERALAAASNAAGKMRIVVRIAAFWRAATRVLRRA